MHQLTRVNLTRSPSATRHWTAVLACVLLAVPALARQPAARVVLDAVRLEPVDQWRQVTGELVSLHRTELATEEVGLVKDLLVEAGDAVEAGTVIATLDSTLAALAATRAKAQVGVMQGLVDQRLAELDRAQRELARFQDAAVREVASITEMDNAETRVAIIKAQLAQARADLLVAQTADQEATTRVEKMTIRAPFAGRIVRKGTERGQWLDRGDSIVELISLKQIEARLDVPERLGAQLRDPSVRVRIVIDAVRVPDPKQPGTLVPFDKLLPIAGIIPQVDERSRLMPIRVTIPNPDELIQPGMTVVGWVQLSARQPRLTVHQDAILRDDAGEFVYFDADGKAIPARVRTRFPVGDRMVIDPGPLQPGMRVIIEGNERLFPSQPIIEDHPQPTTPDADAQADTPDPDAGTP